MNIAEALAIVQKDAKDKGFKLQGPNFAEHPETGEVRNLNQEAEAMAKRVTGAPAAPVLVVPAEGETIAEAAQNVVTQYSKEMGLTSKIPPWILVAGGAGLLVALLYAMRDKKK